MDNYSKQLLERYKNPKYFGRIKNPDYEQTVINKLCADKITVYLKVKDNIVTDYKYDGVGCAISLATADILGDKIIGQQLTFIQKISQANILKWIGVKIGTGRIKCALLSLRAINTLFVDPNKLPK